MLINKMATNDGKAAPKAEQPNYTDEEVAKLLDYDYGFLLDLIYYKLEQMQTFFMSKHVHTGGAKQYAKQMGVAMRLISIAQGKDAFFDDDENTPYVNTKNYKRYEKRFYSCFSLRKEKAWHVLFMYLERRMRDWWD